MEGMWVEVKITFGMEEYHRIKQLSESRDESVSETIRTLVLAYIDASS